MQKSYFYMIHTFMKAQLKNRNFSKYKKPRNYIKCRVEIENSAIYIGEYTNDNYCHGSSHPDLEL